MFVLCLFISLALLIIGITIFSNLIFFPRLRVAQPEAHPFVSILIPARSEAGVIARTVEQALAQTFTNFELLVLDDDSSDGTGVLAKQAAGGDERFRLLHGEALPNRWLGKNWACHQLTQVARGDLLLFLDADVHLQPEALESLVGMFTREKAGLLTVWPTQITSNWGERLVVPLMGFAILGYLPVLPVHYTSWPVFAAANGQCLLFTRQAYQRVGGHAAVRENVVDDVALARRVKRAGLRMRMVDGNRLVSCRMYPGGWPEVRDGFAKNLLAGHGNSILFLLVSTIFHWLVFILPWVWWIFDGGWFALALGLTGVLLRALSAAFTHQRILDALLMPLSVVLMTGIAFRSILWHYRGNAVWKGRSIRGSSIS
jgi:chlorobactene glucosyltransferase